MTFIEYDAADRIATITLNRPEAANAQTLELLDELDAAWQRAADDPEVRVIVLQANGKTLFSTRPVAVSMICKDPSIAAVQGACIAGGLLLCWPCDLIVAADNATFSDPVVSLGIGGVEYHGHTWEWGARKAKELLFTGRKMTAGEAEQLGMVNRVVALDDLRTATRGLAEEIASKHPFALRQAKRAVNQTLDIQGFYAAIQAVFDVHQTGHGHALSESGLPILMTLDGLKTEMAASSGAKGPSAPEGSSALKD